MYTQTYTRIGFHPLLHRCWRIGRQSFCLRIVRRNRVHSFALRAISDVAVVLQHLAVQMTGQRHDRLVRSAALGQFGNSAMAEIVEAESNKGGSGFLPAASASSFVAPCFMAALAAAAPARLVVSVTRSPGSPPSLLWPRGIVSSAAGLCAFGLAIEEAWEEKMFRFRGS